MSSVRTTIEHFWDAHANGDHEALKQVLDPSLTWTVTGRACPISKTYYGWDGFLGELLGGLAAAFKAGTLKMALLGLYVDERQGVGVLHLLETAVAAQTGYEFQAEIANVIRVRDGKIVDVREILDMTEAVRAFGFEL